MQKTASFSWKSSVESTYCGRGELTVDGDQIRMTFATESRAPLLYVLPRTYVMSAAVFPARITLATPPADIPQMVATIVGPHGWYAGVRPMDCGVFTFDDQPGIINDMFNEQK